MEKEILELLKQIQSEITEIKSDMTDMKSDISEMKSEMKAISIDLKEANRKLDNVVDQTAHLTEFETTVLESLDDVNSIEVLTTKNCYDLARIKPLLKKIK